MKDRKKWTEDEEVYLEYYLYGDINNDKQEKNLMDAAEHLEKGIHAVRTKASRLRKNDKKVQYIHRPWTERELEFLKENYEILPIKLMAERLGRSYNSVKIKASKMGVNKHKSIIAHDKEIRKLAAEGKWRTQIARQLGLKVNSVSDYINKNNIECEYCPIEIQTEFWRREEELRWKMIRSREK